jgi:uncharacterized protein YwgA
MNLEYSGNRVRGNGVAVAITVEDRIRNNLLVLYLIDHTVKTGYKVEDDLKAQKLVFLSEKLSVQRKLRSLVYPFFRWHKGPWSKDLSDDLRHLTNTGLLCRGKNGFSLTPEAREILAFSESLLNTEHIFLKPIDETIKEWGHYASDAIKEKVYDIAFFVPRLRKVMRMRDIDEGQILLFGVSESKARKIFTLPEDWAATLELLFDKNAVDSLKAAQKDALGGRTCDFSKI